MIRHLRGRRVFGALAAILVNEEPGRIVAWIPPGSERKLPPGRHQPWEGDWTHTDRPWHGDGVLAVKELAAAHSIWHFRENGAFWGWYANLEDPATATAFGWDSRDHVLDLVRKAGGEWEWKDEDEFEQALAHGVYDEEEARAIRAEGERVMRDDVVPTGWEDWQPDPAWTPPKLPPDWHVL